VTTTHAVSIDEYHNTKRLRRVRDVMAITKMRFLPCVCLRRVEPVKSIGCDGDKSRSRMVAGMRRLPRARGRVAQCHRSESGSLHRIDFSILQDLTDKDLKEELGIVLLGDRRRLLRAIAKLAGTASATPQLAAGSEPSPRDEAERRHLTMMICDLVGSTDWHSATDRILMANGRFRGEADVNGRVAWTASVADDR